MHTQSQASPDAYLHTRPGLPACKLPAEHVRCTRHLPLVTLNHPDATRTKSTQLAHTTCTLRFRRRLQRTRNDVCVSKWTMLLPLVCGALAVELVAAEHPEIRNPDERSKWDPAQRHSTTTTTTLRCASQQAGEKQILIDRMVKYD